MVDIDALRGKIAECRMSQTELAKALGLTPKTFYNRMKRRVFGSDEIETMIKVLNIDEPMKIFFPDNVTCHVTKQRG